MNVAEHTRALLELVEDDRRTQSDAILTEARAQADAMLAQARKQARAQVRALFAQERPRLRSRIDAARANLATRRRLHAQRQAAAWLSLAWQQLPLALLSRWQNQSTRSLWIEGALRSARRALPRGQWLIVHAPLWPDAEQQALAAQLLDELGVRPRFAPDPGIDAGLRITANSNVVDATLAGLTADRNEIGARLLGAWEEPQ